MKRQTKETKKTNGASQASRPGLPYKFYALLERLSRGRLPWRGGNRRFGDRPWSSAPIRAALPPPKYESSLAGLRETVHAGGRGEGLPTLLLLSPEQLLEGDGQPRRDFLDSALLALADSIRLHGLLHPITVRPLPGKNDYYAVVAGERRLRAMEILGRQKVPCIVVSVTPEEAAALALIENLHRQPLNPFELSDAYTYLASSERPPLDPEELGEILSLPPRELEKSLALRCFSPRERTLLLAAELPEDALCAMTAAKTSDDRVALLKAVCMKYAEDGSPAAFVREYLASSAAAAKIGGARRRLILGDIRLFYNTVDKAVSAVRAAGIPAICRKEEETDCYRVTIEIPKEAEAAGAGEMFHVEQPERLERPEAPVKIPAMR